MNRKICSNPPGLISLTDNPEIPKFSIIDSPTYVIGRALDCNLIILKKSVSRKHATLNFNDETSHWSITSHVENRKGVSVGNKDLIAEEPFVLKCGDEISITPFFVFEYKCSPNDLKCCTDFKKRKLTDNVEGNETIVTEYQNMIENYAIENIILQPDSSNPVPSCSNVSISSLPSALIPQELPDSSSISSVNTTQDVVSENLLEFELGTCDKQSEDFRKILIENESLREQVRKYREREEVLQTNIKTLEDDNAQLLNDICRTLDDISKIQAKCDSLEIQIKEKTTNGSTSAVDPSKVLAINSFPQQLEIVRDLFKSSSIKDEEGIILRRLALKHGTIQVILANLAIFAHHSLNDTKSQTEPSNVKSSSSGVKNKKPKKGRSTNQYWAKGTGFGTGHLTPIWDVDQALYRQRYEEEQVTIILQTLASFINPDLKLYAQPSVILSEMNELHKYATPADKSIFPVAFVEMIENSCLLSVLSSYLRNDSVLDMAQHIPVYRAVLVLLRVMSLNFQIVKFLLPSKSSLIELLKKIRNCVDTYSMTLKLSRHTDEEETNEGLTTLIPDIQATTTIVEIITEQFILEDNPLAGIDTPKKKLKKTAASVEEVYLHVMKKLQFDSYDMISQAEGGSGYKFNVAYHYEKNVRSNGDKNHPSRMKRLAQEAVTLSTSLPLSFSSSVFVRCDTDRLDVMKVLIIGPAETPYANGCFEFDVYFPPDYPNSPVLMNLETTGKHTVRFNPNLYKDGKVCLSVLNTWHGSPEEKWNAKTSSFLQVLVSIQSLILVPDPYFNEPGYEKSRGTTSGNASSDAYNANIKGATIRWAMLEQLRNPTPCFRKIIQNHFWIKRREINEQIVNWIEEIDEARKFVALDTDTIKANFKHLCQELKKLQPPNEVAEFDCTDFSIPETTISEPVACSSTVYRYPLNSMPMPSTSSASCSSFSNNWHLPSNHPWPSSTTAKTSEDFISIADDVEDDDDDVEMVCL